MSFAIRIASASSSNGITAATGPKTSSRAIRSSFDASTSVHGNQKPGPSGVSPWKRLETPSRKTPTVARCSALISGPISVSSSAGSPTFTSRSR